MLRTTKYPGKWTTYPSSVPLELGGTGGTSPETARQSLGLIPANTVGLPLGPVPLREDGTVDPKYLGDLATGILAVDGPLTLAPNASAEFFLTTYDSFTEYSVSAINGTVQRKHGVITYTAGAVSGDGGFIVNGRKVAVTITGKSVLQPSILTPVNGATNRQLPVIFTSSAFTPSAGTTDTHKSSDWQVATDAAFTNIVWTATGSTTAKTSWTPGSLPGNTLLYVRVRYTGTANGTSPWSLPSMFTTAGNWRVRNRLFADVAGQETWFGSAAALSSDGRTAVVGAPGVSNGQGVVYFFQYENNVWKLKDKLQAFDAVIGKQFGTAVALSGDGKWLVVGAPADTDAGVDSGSLYVYMRVGSSFNFYRKLRADDLMAGDLFGSAVALNGAGDVLLVGAPGFSNKRGALYAFTRNTDGNWTQQQKYTATDGVASDGFGTSVATNSQVTKILVGAKTESTADKKRGKVYLLSNETATGNWQQLLTFVSSDIKDNDYFGSGVAINDAGTIAVVGAYNTNDAIGLGGSTYVYSLDEGTTPVLKSKLNPKPGAVGDGFGKAVALNGIGDTALIGAPMNDLLAFNAGIVYCYDVLASSIAEVETGSWAAPDAAANDDFGIAVALDPTGTLLAIGADQSDASPGKVYIFSRTAGKYDWAYQQTVTLSGGVAGDKFGFSVAFSNAATVLYVGAPGKNAVYTFSRTGSAGAYTLAQDKTITGPVNGNNFGGALAVNEAGTMLLVGAYGDTGTVYQYKKSGTTWAAGVSLTSPVDAASTYFGRAIAMSADGSMVAIHGGESDLTGSVCIYSQKADVFTLQQRVANPASKPNDLFGASLSLSGNGGLLYLSGVSYSGPKPVAGVEVYAYKTYGFEWLRTLAPADGTPVSSVALAADGTTAVLGSIAAVVNSIKSGAFYSFN